ncbi:MAG: NAD(P)/FAD-dependent oxidoreductase [Intestinibacillus sp.]
MAVTDKAEVVIVGGGITGNAAAYYMAKRGASVIVLEGSEIIGNGGSSRNGGGVRQSARDPRELPLAMHAVEHMWPTLSEELGMDVEYFKKGNLRLGKTEQHLKILQGLCDSCTSQGLDVKMLSGDEVRGINPYLSDEVLGASWCPTDGHANPLRATLAFYRAARRLGARFYTKEEATELVIEKGALRYVKTACGDVFEGDTILVAAGYASRALLHTVGIDVPMNRVLLEAIVTEAEPSMFEQMLGTAMADFYGHQTPHGSFVFGGHTGYEGYMGIYADNENNFSQAISAPTAARAILDYFPRLRDTKLVRSWAGSMDECADKVPVIDRCAEVPGLVIACGFSGHGFGIGPITGLLLSELTLDGKTSTLPIDAFRYDRFGGH